jgi:hypothetical protein
MVEKGSLEEKIDESSNPFQDDKNPTASMCPLASMGDDS